MTPRATARGALAAAGLLVVLVGATAAAGNAARPNAQDRLFLRVAHQANLAEISAARIAQHQAGTSAVRDLAARWITDHTALDRSLTQTAVALDVVLPPGASPEQQALADRYRAARRDEFDRLWVTTQVTEHHRAESLIAAELAAGAADAVRALARAARPVIDAHQRLLDDAAPAAGAAIPAEPNVPRPGSVPIVPTPPSAPPPGWRVTDPAGVPGWTQPRPAPGGTTRPLPMPGGPWPSLTPGPA